MKSKLCKKILAGLVLPFFMSGLCNNLGTNVLAYTVKPKLENAQYNLNDLLDMMPDEINNYDDAMAKSQTKIDQEKLKERQNYFIDVFEQMEDDVSMAMDNPDINISLPNGNIGGIEDLMNSYARSQLPPNDNHGSAWAPGGAVYNYIQGNIALFNVQYFINLINTLRESTQIVHDYILNFENNTTN